MYGFRRSKETEKGAYYHPQFLKGQRQMCFRIKRVSTNGFDEVLYSVDGDSPDREIAFTENDSEQVNPNPNPKKTKFSENSKSSPKKKKIKFVEKMNINKKFFELMQDEDELGSRKRKPKRALNPENAKESSSKRLKARSSYEYTMEDDCTNESNLYEERGKKKMGVYFSSKDSEFSGVVKSGYNEFDCVIDLSFLHAKNIFIDMTKVTSTFNRFGYAYNMENTIYRNTYGVLSNGQQKSKVKSKVDPKSLIKESRIGSMYQADIPEFKADFNYKELLLEEDSYSSTLVNHPKNEKKCKLLLDIIKKNDIKNLPFPGMILVVYVKEIDDYRLCAVKDVENTNYNENIDATITVFDGQGFRKVLNSDCRFSSVQYESLISHSLTQVHQNDNNLYKVDFIESEAIRLYFENSSQNTLMNELGPSLENKLLNNKYLNNSEQSIAYQEWTYEEVDTFCAGVRK